MAPSEFRDVVGRMKELHSFHFSIDLRKEMPQYFWCAQTWENYARDEFTDATLAPWMAIGIRPGCSVIVTADPYYIGVHLIVRGAFHDGDAAYA